MGLKIVYMVFVAIIVAIFVGIGISAFYSEPERPEPPTALKIYKLPADPTADPEILAELQTEQEQYDAKLKIHEKDMQLYNRNVSIIALISAVIIMALSLTFSRQLVVIADGLLLGGALTLLYSIVRVFGSGDDKLGFGIVTISLGITLYLGYTKFIKGALAK